MVLIADRAKEYMLHIFYVYLLILKTMSRTELSNSNTTRMILTFPFFLVAILFSNSEKLSSLTIYSLNLSINIKPLVTEVQHLYTVLSSLSLQLPVKMLFSRVT